MLQLRPVVWIISLLLLSSMSGVAGASFTARAYERKIQRLSEEREVYMLLSQQAISMSERSLSFTLQNQETLSTCIERLYAAPTAVPVVTTKKFSGKGGIGGPNVRRGESRLP